MVDIAHSLGVKYEHLPPRRSCLEVEAMVIQSRLVCGPEPCYGALSRNSGMSEHTMDWGKADNSGWSAGKCLGLALG